MSYHKTIEYLYGLQKFGFKLGLQNIKSLMETLGRPEREFASVHVAGTNGKGSTSAITATILAGLGLKTGLFTSPHMVRFTERIKILERNRELLLTSSKDRLYIRNSEIPEDDVIRITELIKEKISANINPTFFEFVTALAFKYFSERMVDSAVIEVGMGGRLDATNVITPLVSVITSISMDHKEFLGDTISKISSEKAGIIKEGVPVVSAIQNCEALRVIEKKATQNGSALYVYNRDFKGILKDVSLEGIVFDYEDKECHLDDLFIPLTGVHQIENACLAIKASLLFCKASGIELKKELLRDSLKNVSWPGRLELIKKVNLKILFDGAHNTQASEKLASTLKEIYLKHYRKLILILGIMADKDVDGIIKPLLSVVSPSDMIIATAPQYPRALGAKRLEELINAQITDGEVTGGGAITITSTENIPDAIKMAIKISMPDPEEVLVVITGSFYTVGEAKAFLGEKESLRDLWESPYLR